MQLQHNRIKHDHQRFKGFGILANSREVIRTKEKFERNTEDRSKEKHVARIKDVNNKKTVKF